MPPEVIIRQIFQLQEHWSAIGDYVLFILDEPIAVATRAQYRFVFSDLATRSSTVSNKAKGRIGGQMNSTISDQINYLVCRYEPGNIEQMDHGEQYQSHSYH